LNYARAYEGLNPPPSAYSDSIPYGDAAFPPMHYPLDIASAYVPHLQLQQAPPWIGVGHYHGTSHLFLIFYASCET
jgi:hypothetical protein